MHNILEMKHYRKIQLIEMLISKENLLRIDDVAKKLDVSNSTILRDIDILNKDYVEHIKINVTNMNNIEILYESSEEIFYIQYLILNSSNNINLLTEILINPFKTTKEYSHLLGLSLSHIYKGIKQINKSLQQYRIKIISVNNKFFLDTESEILLRRFFSVYLVETSEFKLEDKFKENQRFELLRKKIINKNYESLLFNDYYNYSFLLISIYRNEQGFYLNDNVFRGKYNHVLEDNNEIIHSLMYSPFENNPYFNNRSFFLLLDYLSSLCINNEENKKLFFKIITQIYENEISQQIPAVLFINKYLSFHSSIKKKERYVPVNNIINTISKILKIEMNQYKPLLTYLLLVHFPEFLSNYSLNSIFIVSNLSVTHAYFIKSILIKKIGSNIDFVVIEDEDTIQKESSKNIYITNNRNLKIKNKIIINDFPNKKDIINIRKKLNNYSI